MKFAITVNGQYKALVEFQMGEKKWNGDQAFSGKITTDKFGVAMIEDGQVQPGSGLLLGHVNLGGHDGDFEAKIEGDTIRGEVKFGPFHMLSATFDGVAAA